MVAETLDFVEEEEEEDIILMNDVDQSTSWFDFTFT